MKKQILTVALGFVTVVSFGQKSELKIAEKAIKKQDFASAITAITSAESLIANADAKLKSKFYFLKGQAHAGKKEYKLAADAYNSLFNFEKQIGKKRYTDKAKPMLNVVIQDVSNRAIKFYNLKDYKNATTDFYTTYVLSPSDTSFLYNAAVSASIDKDYTQSLKLYGELKEVGYTGVLTQFIATNKKTGKVENMGSKNQRDLMVKSGQYTNPTVEVSKSKKAEIVKNIGYILIKQGKISEAIVAIQEARKENSKDLDLILTEADLYVKLKRMDKFSELMKKAIEMDPTNPVLYYNLGVTNFNQKKIVEAKKYYLKAIELKPDYTDAYMNLAVLLLDKEEVIVEKMNNLPASDMKSYEKLEKERKDVYKEALPYLEKADSLRRNIDTVRTLLNIYENLEMEDKAKEYRGLFKSMK